MNADLAGKGRLFTVDDVEDSDEPLPVSRVGASLKEGLA